jgi:hypothetical protein
MSASLRHPAEFGYDPGVFAQAGERDRRRLLVSLSKMIYAAPRAAEEWTLQYRREGASARTRRMS